MKVKDLITDLISRLQAEASSETNQKSYCDEEMSKATEKREDLEADVAKHSSKLEAAVARSIDLDGEISTLQSANPQVQHVVNTVEAEMPKIVKETVQRKWPVVNEKINQMTKHPEVPQVHVVEKTVERPQSQIVEQIDEIPETRTDVGTQTSEKAVETPLVFPVADGSAKLFGRDYEF